MKQLLVLSGKGGTGKTTITSVLITLGKIKLFADCDVDAPNLHLTLKEPKQKEKKDFYGMPKAIIDHHKCIHCNRCDEVCEFDAIKNNIIDLYACEGCGLCAEICPVNAINLCDNVSGDLLMYKDDYIFSTAKLRMGSGNSGKLVSIVKKEMLNSKQQEELAIIDGSPGIGCPVIASISGVDLILIVTEPTISGLSDLKRIKKTTDVFQTKVIVCINKYDLNEDMALNIIKYCQQEKIAFAGKIAYDKNVSKAINEGKNVYNEAVNLQTSFKEIYDETIKILNKGE